MPNEEGKRAPISFELRKMMGIGRSRAVDDAMTGGGATTPDDFRCDAEQVEIDEDGVVRKSRPSRFTRPKK
jgi:hypothetical protein